MLSPDVIDQLINRLEQVLPVGSSGLVGEVRRNVSALLQESLGRLDLVSRDEFETQAAVLARTREKLETMESQVRALEALLEGRTGNA